MPQIQLHVPESALSLTGRTAEVDVSIATHADLRGVARLFDAYRVFYGRASNRRAARAFLSERLSRGESVIMLATRRPASGVLPVEVGFAQLYSSFSSVRLGKALILNDLFVVPEARRRGVGIRLVDACIAHARRTRAVSLELETHPDNAAAMRLYSGLGFTPSTEFARLSFPLGTTPVSRAVGR